MALTFTENSPSQLTISYSSGKDMVLTNDPSNPTSIPSFAPGSKVLIKGTLYAQVPESSYGGVDASPDPVTYTMARSPVSGAVNEGTVVAFTVTASDGSTNPYPYTIFYISELLFLHNLLTLHVHFQNLMKRIINVVLESNYY